MPANGLAEARAGYFIKTFLFSMYFNSKNGQFYPNLGSNYISFRKVVFMAVIMDHKKSTAIKKYSRLSLSRTPRDSIKYFEISVPRHIRFAEFRKNYSNNHI